MSLLRLFVHVCEVATCIFAVGLHINVTVGQKGSERDCWLADMDVNNTGFKQISYANLSQGSKCVQLMCQVSRIHVFL